jgi:hypothetical protein
MEIESAWTALLMSIEDAMGSADMITKGYRFGIGITS